MPSASGAFVVVVVGATVSAKIGLVVALLVTLGIAVAAEASGDVVPVMGGDGIAVGSGVETGAIGLCTVLVVGGDVPNEVAGDGAAERVMLVGKSLGASESPLPAPPPLMVVGLSLTDHAEGELDEKSSPFLIDFFFELECGDEEKLPVPSPPFPFPLLLLLLLLVIPVPYCALEDFVVPFLPSLTRRIGPFPLFFEFLLSFDAGDFFWRFDPTQSPAEVVPPRDLGAINPSS
jgi:hypothetical protein